MAKLNLNVENMTPEQAQAILVTLIEKLDELDREDYFGTEGWRHYLGLDD